MITRQEKRAIYERFRRKRYLWQKRKGNYSVVKDEPVKTPKVAIEEIKQIKNMNFFDIFKSRTIWTIIVLFAINGISGIRDLFPASWLPAIDAILGILAIYFRATPRVNFNK